MNQRALYYNADDPGAIYPATPVNRGIIEVLARIEALQRVGIQVTNTGPMSEDARTEEYFRVTLGPVARKHYRVRPCFARAGLAFGRGVPALVVWRDDRVVEDVYPHENKDIPGTYFTISDYFLQLGGLPE